MQILNATNIQLRRKISALTIHVIFDTPRTMRPFFNTIRMLLFLPLRGWALCLCLTVEVTAADVTQDTYPVTNLMTSNSTESGNNLPITLHCQTTPDTSPTASDFLASSYHEHEILTTTNMEVWDYSFNNRAIYDPSTWDFDGDGVSAHLSFSCSPELNVFLPTDQVQLGDPVSLLLHRNAAAPNPGWTYEKEITIDGDRIVIDLLPVEPEAEKLYPTALAHLHLPIFLEDLDAGMYSVEVNWHNPWRDRGNETVTQHFAVVPEPAAFTLLGSLLVTTVFLRRSRNRCAN